MGNRQSPNRADEVLSRENILESYDPRLSFRPHQAIEFMDKPDLGGICDVGRLMQIQSFRKDYLAKGRREFDRLETWRQHYIHCGAPFLFVPGDGNTCYIYKYRVIKDRSDKAKNHRRKRMAKLSELKKT